MKKTMNYRRRYKANHHLHRYINLTFVIFSLIVASILMHTKTVYSILVGLGSWGYLGAFIAGLLFVSTFTAAIGAVILLAISQSLNPLFICLFAGFGAVFGDLFILHFVKDNLVPELKDLYTVFGGKHLSHLLHSKYFKWSLPVIGALIIASPLPDELGVSLIGISKMTTLRFMIMSFLLNTSGILLIIASTHGIKI